MISLFDRAGSLARGLRRKPSTQKARRDQDRRLRLAIDQLEQRLALAITTPLQIGGTTVGSFYDAPTGPGNLGDLVTVSIEGTSGTVIFNGGAGVADGTDIQTIEILNASPDFQMTFGASIVTTTAVPYGSDGVVNLGVITTSNVIRGINTVRGPITNVASPWEIETSAIHLYTFNDGTVSGTTVTDLIGGLDGTLVNGATVANGQLVLADLSQVGPNVQYMQLPADVIPQGSTALTAELWFTASSSSPIWGRGFDFGEDTLNYMFFTPVNDTSGSRAAITQGSSEGEKRVDGPTSYNDNLQHLATVTIDDAADTLTYYIDGAQIGTVALAGTTLSGLEAINNFLGRSQFEFDPGFIGSMNQFALYDRALTPTEVLANYTAGPISGALTPVGFTQTTPGSGTLQLVGNQLNAFPSGALVCATPLLPSAAAPSFGNVYSAAYDSNTNVTTITLANGVTTAAGTTAGALTLAKAVQPEFRLTTFVGKNFSNRSLKDGGGLFVDVVQGGSYVYDGETIDNLGILLTDGLLAYSTIGIRKELAATVVLGTTNKASVDGRMFVESATPESILYVGSQNARIAKNSTFQLQGGAGEFGADVLVNQAFNGVVNLAGPATGEWLFVKGVGSRAVLNAYGWEDVAVNGNFAGTINSTSTALPFTSIFSPADLVLFVDGNLTSTARINSGAGLLMEVVGSVQKGAVISAAGAAEMAIAGNFLGAASTGLGMAATVSGNLSGARLETAGAMVLNVGRSVINSSIVGGDNILPGAVGGDVGALKRATGLNATVSGNIVNSRFASALGEMVIDVTGSVQKGSSFSAVDQAAIDVAGNFDGTVAADDLRFFVDGNVSKASRIAASWVIDWQNAGTANFEIGGRLDGIVNVGEFYAIGGDIGPDSIGSFGPVQEVTILGNGAGSNARFNVGSFNPGDTLVFNGNFNGNMRVLQDLTSNLTFNGNVSRLSFGGRIGSFAPGNTITPVNVAINVTGKLLYLNSNSYFEATTPGKAGSFWNDSAKATPATGTLSTGSYVKVVPTLQTPTPLPPPPTNSFTAPTAPQTFSAKSADPSLGILVTFSAPSSDGGLPVLYYEYSTNALAGTPTWRKFDTASQGPGTDIALTVDSNGGAWIPGNTYDVAVRAVNAIGSTATTSSPVKVIDS
ncbi:MAG: LamG-like jellyroll fold domain-containing protein [Pirellulales bacterium]